MYLFSLICSHSWLLTHIFLLKTSHLCILTNYNLTHKLLPLNSQRSALQISSDYPTRSNRFQAANDVWKSTAIGIYWHSMWLKLHSSVYTGQASGEKGVNGRIQKHCQPSYRQSNPSFHYDIFERSTRNSWIIMRKPLPDDFDRLKLNILEKWGALLMQSESKNRLQRYLPPGATLHVGISPSNVANLLAQSSVDRYWRGLWAMRDSP